MRNKEKVVFFAWTVLNTDSDGCWVPAMAGGSGPAVFLCCFTEQRERHTHTHRLKERETEGERKRESETKTDRDIKREKKKESERGRKRGK